MLGCEAMVVKAGCWKALCWWTLNLTLNPTPSHPPMYPPHTRTPHALCVTHTYTLTRCEGAGRHSAFVEDRLSQMEQRLMSAERSTAEVGFVA